MAGGCNYAGSLTTQGMLGANAATLGVPAVKRAPEMCQICVACGYVGANVWCERGPWV
jgi:hypothetical protein